MLDKYLMKKYMPTIPQREYEPHEQQGNRLYTFAGYSTVIVLLGIVIDLFIGSSTGGDLSALPQTAAGRFIQIQQDWFLGLYNLDLLNVFNQLMLIPAYIALYTIHKTVSGGYSLLAMILFLVGTTVFVTSNAALPMLDLSNKYAAATTDPEKALFAAAGEAMLAQGAHGSAGVFIAFMLPNFAGIMMSFVMLQGKIFTRTNAWLGIAGSFLIVIYLLLVTFLPQVKTMATLFAAPGGLLLMAWMIMFTMRFFRLGKT